MRRPTAGVNYIRFNPDHSRSKSSRSHAARSPRRARTTQHPLLYTDQQRDADGILKKQSEGTADKMSDAAPDARSGGRDAQDHGRAGRSRRDFGALLHEGWELKRSLGFGISNQGVDEWYRRTARANGAMGGKLLGAGGGGFLLVMAPPERARGDPRGRGQPAARCAFRIDRRGSRVIFISEPPALRDGTCMTSTTGIAAALERGYP